MIGFDPYGTPHNKAALLAASFLTGTFGAAFMLLLAWNASNIGGHSKKVRFDISGDTSRQSLIFIVPGHR